MACERKDRFEDTAKVLEREIKRMESTLIKM